MVARGHAWLPGGGCVVAGGGGACVGYDEIRSMSGRYASYWNAFLFYVFLDILRQKKTSVNTLPKQIETALKR